MDQGVWQGPFDPDNGLTVLDDDTYRLLLGQNRRQPLGRHAGNLGRHPEPDLPGRHPRADRGQRRHVGGHRRGRRAAFGAVPGPADRGYIPIKPEGVRISYVLPSGEGRCSVLTCRTNTSRGSTTDSGDRCLPVEFAGSIRKTLRGYQSNLSFGTAAGANVLAPADYQALASRNAGFSAGTAKSKELNTVWRQASFVAAMLGQYIADKSGQDVLDNGDLAALQASSWPPWPPRRPSLARPPRPRPPPATRAASSPPPLSWPATSPRLLDRRAADAGHRPIIVAECSEVWTWVSTQYYTGYRSPLCGRPVDGHTVTPLASEVDAVGGELSKTDYARLWGMRARIIWWCPMRSGPRTVGRITSRMSAGRRSGCRICGICSGGIRGLTLTLQMRERPQVASPIQNIVGGARFAAT